VEVPLPYSTLIAYHRAFATGTLEKYCSGSCPICRNPIEPSEYRYRKIVGLRILRGRCRGPERHSFTFLPIFVPPGKWHSYPAIEEALCFVGQEKYADRPSVAFEDWEKNRELRIAENLFPGPGSTTIRRWVAELSPDPPSLPWAERANQALLAISEQRPPSPDCPSVLDDPPDNKRPPAMRTTLLLRPPHPNVLAATGGNRAFARLLSLLRLLGEALLGEAASARSASCLGMGLWFLEGTFAQRCLARVGLAGNIVPWLVPEVAETPPFAGRYPRQRSPPS
jgi:hypothetical protein